MKSLIKPLLWSVALVVGLAAEPFLNAKEGEMPKKTMMYYGGFEIEEMFDASQWFADGIYKPRNIDADGGASPDTMLRIKPLRFTADQYAELPQIASSELREEFPELDRKELIDNPPDLSQRIRYAYSAFAAPNKPEDYHYLYLTLDGRRFVITFSRDALSGENLTGKSAKEITGEYASQAEHRKTFAEIEEIERKAR